MVSILVVDDNTNVRRAISQGLEFAGYRVVAAEDGWKAMVGFRRQGADLVILDMSSNHPDCHQTISEIRSLKCDVKVLGLSRSARAATEASESGSYFVGIDRVLTKPFSLLDLLVAVDELLAASAGSRLIEAS